MHGAKAMWEVEQAMVSFSTHRKKVIVSSVGKALLRAGWEPFGITQFEMERAVMWFRREITEEEDNNDAAEAEQERYVHDHN